MPAHAEVRGLEEMMGRHGWSGPLGLLVLLAWGSGSLAREKATMREKGPGQEQAAAPERVRARALGVAPGVFAPGPLTALTDVQGVRVGHETVVKGDSVRTGVTAILPHPGNLFRERVPAAIHVFNGFGKLLGSTQVNELGELESPILLTCTLCVWRVADGLVGWMREQPGMEDVRSLNPVVAETNDGRLNAIRKRPLGAREVRAALAAASGGPVAEGSVGAGTGTVAFGWKGGIGTSSRVLPARLGGWTVGCSSSPTSVASSR
ncbi:MAG TPA: P1 family peptidase [Myxococcaceae bacterium]|nr:P1 family peptidase [Myxococcaceae bacterium]